MAKVNRSALGVVRPRCHNSFGMAAAFLLMFTIMLALPTQAQTFCVLYAFTGGVDGYQPWGGLAQQYSGSTGHLYGTTLGGGSGAGVVYEVKKDICDQAENGVLHAFGSIKNDGRSPYDALILSSGYLYGTTEYGGAYGDGTVFSLYTANNQENFYNLLTGTDGDKPIAGVIRDSSGYLYGTTYAGGSYGHGAVFRISSTGVPTLLHSFAGGTDGASPTGGLVLVNGYLYGTTLYGGSSTANLGTIFKVSKTGTGYAVLHRFSGAKDDGASPYAGLLFDSTTGNFYGTAMHGGLTGQGVVFETTPSGETTVRYSFNGTTGQSPAGRLIMDSAHNLYGTTTSGGNFTSSGVVFKLDSSFNPTVLHAFSGPDGAHPYAGLVMNTAGELYGTTPNGGAHSAGTVFWIIP